MDAATIVKTVETVLRALGLMGTTLRSLTRRAWPAAEYDCAKLVQDSFAGALQANSRVRLEGVLFPFVCTENHLIYSPLAPVALSEKQTPQPGSEVRVQLQASIQPLSVPASRLNDLTLENGSVARIGWLYPPGFTGLEFGIRKGVGEVHGAGDLFLVQECQRPILCLLPASRGMDHHLFKQVEITCETLMADALSLGPAIATLSPFDLNILSNCYRPFGPSPAWLALDLRGDDVSVKEIASVQHLPATVGIEGVLDQWAGNPDEKANLFAVVADAVPDRAGMGALRSIGASGLPAGLVSIGRLRWFLDTESPTVAVYRSINFADPVDVTSSASELFSHWQAWQKKARNEAARILDRRVHVHVVRIWDPARVALAHPGGFTVPAQVEKQVFGDPAARAGIDWLKVGTGRA